jgi:hypothetical protein
VARAATLPETLYNGGVGPKQPRRVMLGAVAVGALVGGALGLCGCGGGLPARSTAPTTAALPPTSPTTKPGATTPPPVPAISPTRPGAALLRSVLADAAAEQWVHAVSVSAATPTQAATTFVSDDGPTSGFQDITIGSVSGEIRVVGDLTYIRGTPEALEELFDVPADVATQLSNTWVTLRAGDSEYQTVTVGVTLSSFLGEIAFSGTVNQGTATLGGTPTTVIEGKLSSSGGEGTGALYVSRAPKPLPLLWVQAGSTGTTRTTFGEWGRAVEVTAPSGAVPLPAAAGGITTIARMTSHPPSRRG